MIFQLCAIPSDSDPLHFAHAHVIIAPVVKPGCFRIRVSGHALRDLDTPAIRQGQGRGTAPIFSPDLLDLLAELERSLITERTRAGVVAAKRRVVKFGRKPKLTAVQIEHTRKLIDAGESRQYVADLLKVGRVTLYRALAT